MNTNTFASIGEAALSTGMATVTGAGSKWDTGYLSVGSGGDGRLTIEDAGSVTSSTGSIGRSFGGVGVATVIGIGSTWGNTESLYVGDGGHGALDITAGGMVSNADGIIGYQATSTGAATVAGSTFRPFSAPSRRISGTVRHFGWRCICAIRRHLGTGQFHWHAHCCHR